MNRDTCDDCGHLLTEPRGTTHARGTCPDCGRMRYRLPTAEGIRTEEGDELVVKLPPITLTPSPSMKLTRPGMSWLISQLLWGEPCATEEDLQKILERDIETAEDFLKNSELMKDFDIETNDDEHAKEMVEFIEKNQHTREWWAFLLCTFAKSWLERDQSDRMPENVSLWNAAKARSVFVASGEIQSLAWRGYQAYGIDALRECLQIWDNRTAEECKNEEFWQSLIERNPLLINMIFVGPVAIEEGKAYVGGKRVDNRGGRVVDFLLRYSVGGNSALLEIKTPSEHLLGAIYRQGIYRVSGGLTGAIVQVSSYKDSLLKEFNSLQHGKDFVAFDPTCIVLTGDYKAEVGDDLDKRRSFELFRQAQSGVLIITYDELFERVRGFLKSIGGG